MLGESTYREEPKRLRKPKESGQRPQHRQWKRGPPKDKPDKHVLMFQASGGPAFRRWASRPTLDPLPEQRSFKFLKVIRGDGANAQKPLMTFPTYQRVHLAPVCLLALEATVGSPALLAVLSLRQRLPTVRTELEVLATPRVLLQGLA